MTTTALDRAHSKAQRLESELRQAQQRIAQLEAAEGRVRAALEEARMIANYLATVPTERRRGALLVVGKIITALDGTLDQAPRQHLARIEDVPR